MHKDLNAVKGGCAQMKLTWEELEVAPTPLANRDNAAILAAVIDGLAEPAAAAHATASTVGGGEKLTALFGAFLNHKDDKNQHDTFRHYAHEKLGYIFTFPDTSNTRLGSHLEAAAELLELLEFYIQFIAYVKELKEKRTLKHLEENALKGLLDGPTRIELAAMTLYRETISLPYIVAVRGAGLESNNALNMGPLHAEVAKHIKNLIENPDLILAVDARPELATLNGFAHWDRPGAAAVAAVHCLAPELPHLRAIFVTFLDGALETWTRFSAEFNDERDIAKFTEAEKKTCWMPTTNDANEGSLGEYRSYIRHHPTGGLLLFNSLAK